MVDLAYTEEEQREHSAKCCDMPSDYKGPKYPWGLSVHFDNSVLDKLSKNVSDFKIGEEVQVPVTLRVTSLSANESEDGEGRQSVGLVMTSIDMPKSDSDKAKTLFGDSDD